MTKENRMKNDLTREYFEIRNYAAKLATKHKRMNESTVRGFCSSYIAELK